MNTRFIAAVVGTLTASMAYADSLLGVANGPGEEKACAAAQENAKQKAASAGNSIDHFGDCDCRAKNSFISVCRVKAFLASPSTATAPAAADEANSSGAEK